MSAPVSDGGPAFPVNDLQGAHRVGMAATGGTGEPESVYIAASARAMSGMSLRDYFAAKFAHAELMTCGVPGAACDALIESIKKTGEPPENHMARCAYEMADAMLRAREARP